MQKTIKLIYITSYKKVPGAKECFLIKGNLRNKSEKIRVGL